MYWPLPGIEERGMYRSNEQPEKYLLTMRSKTTFGTDIDEIFVWPGDDPQKVAERVAEGYGAMVESLVVVGE